MTVLEGWDLYTLSRNLYLDLFVETASMQNPADVTKRTRVCHDLSVTLEENKTLVSRNTRLLLENAELKKSHSGLPLLAQNTSQQLLRVKNETTIRSLEESVAKRDLQIQQLEHAAAKQQLAYQNAANKVTTSVNYVPVVTSLFFVHLMC